MYAERESNSKFNSLFVIIFQIQIERLILTKTKQTNKKKIKEIKLNRKNR